MNNPDMLKSAMAAMSKMTPDQLMQMQQQMQNIPQSVLQDQMRMFQNMSPEQQREAARQAENFNPADIASQTSQFAASQGWGGLKEAEELKKEGNRLHGLGQYSSAIKKYELASSKVSGDSSAAGKALRTACKLNLGSCYLNTGQNQKCIAACTEVAQSDPGSLKAHFRRGQAYLSAKSYALAVKDLERAVHLASAEERGLIQTKLEEARAALGDSKEAGDGGPVVEEPDSPTREDGHIEEVDISPAPQPSTSRPFGSQAAAGSYGAAGSSSSSAADPMAAMLQNPDMMKQAMEMMQNLPAEQLEAMSRSMQGPGGQSMGSQAAQVQEMLKNPETMSAMQKMMASMKPEDIAAMQRQAGQMGMGGGAPGGMDQQEQMAKMMQDPETMKAVQGMMSSMKAEDLVAMSKQAGMEMTPDQAEMVAGTMKKLTPEQMAKILAAANYLQRAKAILWKYKALFFSLFVLIVSLLCRHFHFFGL